MRGSVAARRGGCAALVGSGAIGRRTGKERRMAALFVASQWIWMWLRAHWRTPGGRPHGFARFSAGSVRIRCNRKPEWVLRQLILLKAHLPNAGCRTLALTFNRVFAHREVSVSKSFVHKALREQAYAVWLARKAIRSAKPPAVAINHCWGI